MKGIFFIILAFAINISATAQSSVNTVWTHKYKQKLNNYFNIDLKRQIPDAAKRAKLITYIIAQLKIRLPTGIESVSVDSLNKISATIGKEYSYNSYIKNKPTGLKPTYVKWTNEIEKIIREATVKSSSTSDLKNINNICDCVILQLKKIYPQKLLVPIEHRILTHIISTCKDELEN